ncbi:metallophosphoesterase family protein [Heyndrickxia sporothermodurans]
MKLLIVSDSHGLREELQQLKEKYAQTVVAMIHCGDSELLSSDEEVSEYLIVRGNCDYDRQFPLDIKQKIEGNTIFITHGHHYNVKMTLMNLLYKAKEIGAGFVFFGHSHMLGAEMIKGILFLNPGSLFMPRGRKEKTYAIVEKKNDSITTKFYTNTHEELVELRQTFIL